MEIKQRLRAIFFDPQRTILFVVLAVATLLVLAVGNLLAPVIASLIIAFLLESVVRVLERWGCLRLVAVILVFSLFMLFLAVSLLGLVPLLVSQITDLIHSIPDIIAQGQDTLHHLPKKYPQLLTPSQSQAIQDSVTTQLSLYGQQVLAFSLSSMRSIFSFVVYLVLMPLMVFFFLKDKSQILAWVNSFLPKDHALLSQVLRDVRVRAGNYVRGRIWEMLVVWLVTYLCFLLTGLEYAMLLSLVVGLSVILPYIGAVVATVPVAIIAYFQWGLDGHFYWTMAAYISVQVLDANILVPLLLSGAVNLHPIASIMAILVFGGIWGFWGVFFAIPLATVIHAVLKACTSCQNYEQK